MKQIVNRYLRGSLVAFCFLIGWMARAVDIGFQCPYEDWRTPIQLTAKTTKPSYYDPLSVVTTNDQLAISFGWTFDVGVALPPVRFRVLTTDYRVLLEWTEPSSVATTVTPDTGWRGGYLCDVFKYLNPGDYAIEAELDPENTLGDTNRSNNKTLFRFAVRDAALQLEEAFNQQGKWENLKAVKGNDFAQEPFAAMRQVAGEGEKPSVQFGPYVPMNGMTAGGRKAPLDLVIAIDDTGSMSDCIRGLLNNIGVLIDRLLKGDGNEPPIEDLRIKLVSFGDEQSDRYSYGWFEETEFTSDVDYLKRKLNSDMFFDSYSTWFGGGGNGAESSFDALWYIASGLTPNTHKGIGETKAVSTPYPFRQQGEAARAVILFTDEPAWDPKGETYHSSWYKYPEMTAVGCVGKKPSDLAQKLAEQNVIVKVITDDSLRGWTYGFSQYQNLVDELNRRCQNNGQEQYNEYVHQGVSSLAGYTNNFDDLKNLADNISSSVPVVVVDPSLHVETREMGTLSFKWKNDTTAGTNNMFRFVYTDNGENPVELVCDATDEWEEVKIQFDDECLHQFDWFYCKLGYDGAVSDCGLITDIEWIPSATQLRIDPTDARYPCEGGVSNVVKVFCNQDWTVKVEDGCSWIHLHNDRGVEDGSFTYSVDPNATYDNRTAVIEVTAGAQIGTIVKRTLTVVQEKSPYEEKDFIQILNPEVKPRWPWNSLIDIDFRVVLPKQPGQSAKPVTLQLTGIDHQEDGFEFDTNNWPYERAEPVAMRDLSTWHVDEAVIVKDDPNEGVYYNGCRGVEVGKGNNDSGEEVYTFTCVSSGVFRVTLDLGRWWNKGLWEAKKFHSPKFGIIFNARAEGFESLSVESAPVHVDTRVGAFNTTAAERDDKYDTVGCGGVVITGIEKIGHPDGRLDPFLWDSRKVKDGRRYLDDLFESAFKTPLMTNLSFVVVNEASVEGGLLSENVVWGCDKVHLVRDNVYVPLSASLTIEDGAVVKFCKDATVFLSMGTPNAPSSSYDELNLIVKGAYVTGAYDPTVGGDTLADLTRTNAFLDAGSATQAQDCFVDYRGHYLTNELGLYMLPMYVKLPDGEWTIKWRRFYTCGTSSRYGNLPRPVGSGEDFLGWFITDPDEQDVDEYADKCVYSLDKQKKITDQQVNDWFGDWDDCWKLTTPFFNNGNKVDQIYALSANLSSLPAEERSALEPYVEVVDGSLAEVTLEYDHIPYSGTEKKPAVTLVKVGETEIPAGNYTVEYSGGNFIDRGVYTVMVTFTHVYSGSVSVSYVIEAQEVDNNNLKISFDPVKYKFTGNKFNPPTVRVMVNETTLTAGKDYNLGWSAGDWTSVGTYRATAELKGNYSGRATGIFEIEENPEKAVVLYDDDAKITSLLQAPKRLLYITGTTEGENRTATCGLIDLLKNNLEIRKFVIDNYICRYDDWQTVGSNKCANGFAPDFQGGELPLVGVATAANPGKCLVRTAGYMSATDLLDFLQRAMTAQDGLPDLGASPSEAEVKSAIAAFAWSDPAVSNKITSAEAYAKFRAWVESLANADPPIDIQQIINSPQAYISMRVSSILATPALFEKEDFELKFADFKVSSNNGSWDMVVTLTADGDPLQLASAKEAFAEMVRVGSTVDSLAPLNDPQNDISVKIEGQSAVLTVKTPDGPSAFLKMIIE